MKEQAKKEIINSVEGFHLPRYREIPDIGLFLEQVSLYINEYLKPLDNMTLSGAMIANYAKMKLIDRPNKKVYSRNQIAMLFLITITKTVLSLDDLKILYTVENNDLPFNEFYDYFCDEFENVLFFVFSLKEILREIDEKENDGKLMLRYTLITIANKVYLDKCFAVLRLESKTKPVQ